jgi:hypothetical protein
LSPSGPTGQGSLSPCRRGVCKLVASIAVRGYIGDRKDQKDQKTLKKKKARFKCEEAIGVQAICTKSPYSEMITPEYSGVMVFYPARQWE